MNTFIQEFIDDPEAIFYCSHSGGKDSQAMYLALVKLVPAERICLVHADLGEVEWAGTQEHIHRTTQHHLNVVESYYADKGRLSPGVEPGSRKTLLVEVERKMRVSPDQPPWPSSSARWCTSDLKTGPIYKFIRQDMAARGATSAVNCMGIRAEESPARAKKPPVKRNATLSKAGRTVYDWYPIFEWSTEMVFSHIKRAGQSAHPAYADGNERLSCMFCILGSANDLAHASRVRPELAAKYFNLEARSGYTLFHKKSLADKIASDRV